MSIGHAKPNGTAGKREKKISVARSAITSGYAALKKADMKITLGQSNLL
jgi:hypothetical protein